MGGALMRHLLVLLLLMKLLEFRRQETFELIVFALFCVLAFIIHWLTGTVCGATKPVWTWARNQGTLLIGDKSSAELSEDPELVGFWDHQWFLQRVLSSLNSYDLLECSLVNRRFMEVSRKYLKSYRMQCPEALACLSERLALADSLTLHLGKTSTDLRLFTSLRLAEHLTSLSFHQEGSSLGFKRSSKSELTILKRLSGFRQFKDASDPVVLGINALSNLQVLKISRSYRYPFPEALQLSNLTSLDLTSQESSPMDLAKLPSMKKLRCLRLVGVELAHLTAAGSPISELNQLTHLELVGMYFTAEFIEEVIPELKDLRSLSLSISSSLRELPYLEALTGLTQLELLKLFFDFELKADSLVFLTELFSLKSLEIELPRKPGQDLFSQLEGLTCPLSLSLNFLNSLNAVHVCDNLRTLTQLTGLDVDLRNSFPSLAFFFAQEPSVVTLSLKPATSELDLTPLERFPRLVNLKITVLWTKDLCNLLDFIGENSNLRELTFVFSTPDLLIAPRSGLKWLSNLTNLTSLTLDLPLLSWNCIRYIEIGSLTSLEELTLLSQVNDKLKVFPYRFFFDFPESLRWLRISSSLLMEHQEWELQSKFPSLRRITRM